MTNGRAGLPGSEIKFGSQPHAFEQADASQTISVTLTLRRGAEGAGEQLEQQLLSGTFKPLSREDAAQTLGAAPQDVAAVRAFLTGHGLTITSENAAARTIKAEGSVAQMAQAFATRLGLVSGPDGSKYLSYEGPLSVPQALVSVIQSVVGLDQRPIARARSTSET